MTEQLLHIDVILVSFWSELQLERAQSQVLGLASLLCANVRFVCDIIIDSGDTKSKFYALSCVKSIIFCHCMCMLCILCVCEHACTRKLCVIMFAMCQPINSLFMQLYSWYWTICVCYHLVTVFCVYYLYSGGMSSTAIHSKRSYYLWSWYDCSFWCGNSGYS